MEQYEAPVPIGLRRSHLRMYDTHSEREHAVLEWTEALTLISGNHVPSGSYAISLI